MTDRRVDFTGEQKARNPYLWALEAFRDKRVKKARDYVVAKFSLLCAKFQELKLKNIDRTLDPRATLDLTYYESLAVPPKVKVEKFSDYDRALFSFENYIEKWVTSAEFYQRVTLEHLREITLSSTMLIQALASVNVDARQVDPTKKDPTLRQVYLDIETVKKIDPLASTWDKWVAHDLFTLRASDVVLGAICGFFGLPNDCFKYYNDRTIEDALYKLLKKDKTLKMLRADIPTKEGKRLQRILGTLSFFAVDDYSIYERLRESLIYAPEPTETASGETEVTLV